jgi:lipoprotein signal peptidase
MKKYFKWILLVLIIYLSFQIDQISKRWAEKNLANPDHPIPVQISAADEGKPLKLVLTEKSIETSDSFSGNDGWSKLTLLSEKKNFTSSDKLFSYDITYGNIVGFYLFDRKDLKYPPRRLIRNEHILLEKMLSALLAEMPDSRIRELSLSKFRDMTLKEYLLSSCPWIDEEDADQLITNFLYPIYAKREPVDPDMPVKTGDIFLVQERKITLIPDHLEFQYAENPGAAWGFLADADESFRQVFFSILSVFAVFVIFYMIFKLPKEDIVSFACLAFILGGAFGNLIDRLRYHYVVDFIEMYVKNYHWPTYNAADIWITCGVIVLLGKMMFTKKKEEKSK